MERHRVIGGEFELPLRLFSAASRTATKPKNFVTYSSGRSALFNILKTIDKRRVLIPDYVCQTVISAAEAAGKEVVIYAVTDSLIPDYTLLAQLYSGDDACLFVNYFGLIDCGLVVKHLRAIDADMLIIQDNVQAPYAMFDNQNADYAFTSFRKSFPCPDGSWAYSKKNDLRTCKKQPDFHKYKTAGGILKALNVNVEFDDIYLDLMHKGEEMIDDDYLSDMSQASKSIIEGIDWQRAALIRKRNASYLLSKISTITPPSNGLIINQIPLFIPVVTANRDKIRREMFKHNIFCPVHWPIESKKYNLNKGEEMSQKELSLIVDQRYNLKDMQAIIDIIEQNI